MKKLFSDRFAILCILIMAMTAGCGEDSATSQAVASNTINPVRFAYHTVATRTDGTLWVWGYNGYGQLGNGTVLSASTPTQIGTGATWAVISAGSNHTAAIRTNGTLWTWGANWFGQLGNGDNALASTSTPTQVGTGITWASVAAGTFHTASVKTDGTLWAWGYNDYGQLGNGDNALASLSTPTQVGTDVTWASVSAGKYHTVALKTSGSLWAWGYNGYGQLGDGTLVSKNTPTQIGTATNWASVSAGGNYTAAVKTDGTLWAWGENFNGQLGDGTDGASAASPQQNDKQSPVKIGTAANWLSVSAGANHTAAIKTDGTLWVWGSNWVGQLGDGTTTFKNAPIQVGNDADWSSVSAETYYTVAVKTNGTLWVWGYNAYGQLGDGTTVDKNVPLKIGTATNWAPRN